MSKLSDSDSVRTFYVRQKLEVVFNTLTDLSWRTDLRRKVVRQNSGGIITPQQKSKRVLDLLKSNLFENLVIVTHGVCRRQ